MSIIDLIMENQMIILSLGIGLLPLLLAAFLFMKPRISKFFRGIKQRRQLAKQEAIAHSDNRARKNLDVDAFQQVIADEDETSDAVAEDHVDEDEDEQEEENPETAVAEESQKDNAMQDLLSSVFEDTGALEKFEVLLSDATPIDSEELLELCNEIANGLRHAASSARGSRL